MMTNEFIENPANVEKVEAFSFLSDMHKDAYGFRPRFYNLDAMTVEDIQVEIEKCSKVIDKNMSNEAIQLEVDIKAFNKLVADIAVMGANDYDTAVKWMFDGFNKVDEVVDFFAIESFLYFYGIMHSELGNEVTKILVDIYGNSGSSYTEDDDDCRKD